MFEVHDNSIFANNSIYRLSFESVSPTGIFVLAVSDHLKCPISHKPSSENIYMPFEGTIHNYHPI